MHSYKYQKKTYSHDGDCTASNTVNFHFDSGLEGDLIIAPENQPEVRIPAEAILELVAREYVLPKKIAKLENMSLKNLLLSK